MALFKSMCWALIFLMRIFSRLVNLWLPYIDLTFLAHFASIWHAQLILPPCDMRSPSYLHVTFAAQLTSMGHVQLILPSCDMRSSCYLHGTCAAHLTSMGLAQPVLPPCDKVFDFAEQQRETFRRLLIILSGSPWLSTRIYSATCRFSNNPDVGIFEISCRNTVGACVQPGLYAMVGAAAALGGVTRMTGTLETWRSLVFMWLN